MGVFDSSVYYRLTSDNYGGERALSCRNDYIPHSVTMSLTTRFDSDNWQLFGQDGVYFIRNYNYNTTYHLGIDSWTSDRKTPVMLPATTELGQQWLIVPWDAKNSTYRLSNRLLVVQGIDTFMGVGIEDMYDVHMQSTSFGGVWSVTLNVDKGKVSADMLGLYSAIQTPADWNKTNAATPSGITARPTALPSPTQSSDDLLYTPGRKLIPVEIAGIVVGIVSFLGMLLIFYFIWRRYKKYGTTGTRGVPGPAIPPRHGRAEVVQEQLPAYSANQHTSWSSQTPTLQTGVSGHYGNRTRPKESDEQSIELPPYGRPSVEERQFV